jgi:DNA-binding GntR family transcriptional regulator
MSHIQTDISLKAVRISGDGSASLAKQVYKELHWAIITGKIPSGTRLVETTLATHLGVSRTPVREALQKLVSEGTLYAIPRAGYIVEDMTERDVVELFMARAAVERLVTRLAAERVTAEDLKLLEANLREMDKLLRGKLTGKMVDLDIQFHQLLGSIAKSKILQELNQVLIKRTLRFRVYCLRIPVTAEVTRDGHMQIIEALRGKDPNSAEAAMTSHLEDTKQIVAECVGRLRQGSFLPYNVEFYDR